MTRLPLIGLAGRPGAGKRTVLRILCDYHAFAHILPAGADIAHTLIDDFIAQIEAIAGRYHYSGTVIEIPDEYLASFVRARGGTVWHLLRPVPGGPGSGIAAQPGDRTLDNTGTLDQLEITVDHVLHAPFEMGR